VSNSELSFVVQSTGPDLHLTVKLDDKIIYDGFPGKIPEKVTWVFDDSGESTHLLCFKMSGKMPEHTTISASGEILQDRVIKIEDIAFDDIILGHMVTELAKYHHDFNGTSENTVQKFYGAMGCNGTVQLEFATPIYLWLLENM